MSQSPANPSANWVKIVVAILGVLILTGVILLARQFAQRPTLAPLPPGAGGQGTALAEHPGKRLISGSDCLACHAPDAKLIGPSFKEIAGRYDETPDNLKLLAGRVKTGSSGVWGPIPMTAHPGNSDADLQAMVSYMFASAKGPAGASVDLAALVEKTAIKAVYTRDDVRIPTVHDRAWEGVPASELTLSAQPMTTPMPKSTLTPWLRVQARHDGEWLAFRLRWPDKDPSISRVLGTFSDAVALQFPAKRTPVPPPIAMGAGDQPVHVYHWRTEFQQDKELGFHDMKDIYPNMSVDIYPLELPADAQVPRISAQEKEMFNAGQAATNPQSFRKSLGIDEILAAGFGTSSVVERVQAQVHGEWRDGHWTLVFARPLRSLNGSVLEPGEGSFVAFAVWQGGEGEVGSRKSLTLKWVPLDLAVPANGLTQR